MAKINGFLRRTIYYLKQFSIHASILMLSLGVIGADAAWGKDLERNIVWTEVRQSDFDIKKADVLLSYVTKLVPPLYEGQADQQGNIFLAENNSFFNKPSLPNTIISTLPREKITTYTVSEGETFWTISYKFEITLETLLWANNLKDTDALTPGQVLTILPVNGLLYTPVEGDTVEGVAASFKVAKDKIMEQNKLASNTLVPGQQLVLPGAKKYVPQKAPVPNYVAGSPVYTGGYIYEGSGSFIWPVNSGSRFISQYFGWVTRYYKHTGIDLDKRNGLDIIASDRGTVVAASYGWGGGYGNHVIVDHGNGYQTLYAHLSSIGVTVGQNVERGSSLGVMGTTGISTGTHLHFEIRQNGVAINPLLYVK